MEQFAIAGYSGSGCVMVAIDGSEIYQVDYFGNRQQLIGKTASAYAELEATTQEFFAELARAFLLDEDGPGPKPKMSAYYCGIVKVKN